MGARKGAKHRSLIITWKGYAILRAVELGGYKFAKSKSTVYDNGKRRSNAA